MIKSFKKYTVNESKLDDYNVSKEKINKLIEDGSIVLNGITLDDVMEVFFDKSEKYPRFGFEALMIDFANGKGFLSEATKQDMLRYAEILKTKYGIDTTKLEEYSKGYNMFYTLHDEIDELENEYDEDADDAKEEGEKIDKKIKVAESYRHFGEDLKVELSRISKIVVKKL